MCNLFYKLMNFCGGLVFYAPVSLLIRTSQGITIEEFFILQIIVSLITLLGEIPTGMIVDKIGYKNALVLSQGLLTIARGMFLFADSMSWFVMEAILEGIAFCFMSGTDVAYLYSVSGDEHYAGERAKSENWGTAGFIISTLSYAIIYHYLALKGLIVATVFATFGGVIFAILLPQSKVKKSEEKKKTADRIPIQWFAQNISLMLISGALSLGWLEINYFYVDKLVSTGISVEWMSLIILGYSLVQMLLPWIISFLERWKKYLISEVLLLSAVMLLLLFMDTKYVFIPIMLILPLLLDMAGVYVSKYINVQIDAQHQEENRATVLSIMNMGSDVLEIVFLLLSVMICEGSGNITFLISGGILLLLGVVTGKNSNKGVLK